MEDISEAKAGHRNVLDDVVLAVFGRVDIDRDGVISKREFETFFKSPGVSMWYL